MSSSITPHAFISVDFHIGGHVTLEYPLNHGSGEVFQVAFDNKVKLNKDIFRTLPQSQIEHSLSTQHAHVREGTLFLETCFYFDQPDSEVILGVYRSLPILAPNMVCFSSHLGSFIILHIERSYEHSVQYTIIICLEPTSEMNYHSL